MFSGIIEETGVVHLFERRGGGAVLEVHGGFDPKSLEIGESIATNGVCLTVRELTAHGFDADLSAETLARTTLGELRVGQRVNLERSLCLGDRIGGHFVFGHVDVVGRIESLEGNDLEVRLCVSHPGEFARYVVDKGSVAIDGISLTVCNPEADRFYVALIPHTLAATTLRDKKPGDAVNLEADMLARYAQRAIDLRS